MSRPGRIPNLTPHTYVLTAAEVARLYFRRGPDFIHSGELAKRHPSFPAPRKDGLYHRKQIETWVDSTFGLIADLADAQESAAIMEAAKRGTRQRGLCTSQTHDHI